MNRRIAVYMIFLVPVLGSMCNYLHAQGDSEQLAAIFDAWKARQKKVESFKFTWDAEATVIKGAMRLPGSKEAFPPKDLTKRYRIQLSVDGEKMRFSREGPEWSQDKEMLVPAKYISVYDGNVSKTYWAEGPLLPNGAVLDKHFNADVRSSQTKPLLWAFRYFVPTMNNPRLLKLVLPGQTGAIDGSKCVILKEPPQPGQTVTMAVWVDLEKDKAIRRMTITEGEKALFELTISLTKDGMHGWLPSAWQSVSLSGSGALLDTEKCTVVDYCVNCKLESDEFRVEFAPGTEVTDMKSGKRYVVKSDGGNRFLKPGENAPNPEKKDVASDDRASWPSLKAFVGMFLLVVVAVFVFLIFKRKK